MRRYSLVTVIAILAVGSVLPAIFSGCKEKDVYLIPDEEYIVDYIGHAEVGKELFRVSGFFGSTPYTLPFDSAVITDRVLGNSRNIQVDVSSGKVDHGVLGEVKDALVTVTDRFTLEVTRVHNLDTLVDTVDTDLRRQVFFMKLGDNSELFSGWVPWRMDYVGAGANGPFAIVRSTTGVFTNVIGDTVELRDVDTVAMGSRLKVTTRWGGDSLSVCHLLSDYDQNGEFTKRLVRYYDGANYDSLSFATPTNSPRFYNEFMIQSVSPVTFPRRSVLVIPYVLK